MTSNLILNFMIEYKVNADDAGSIAEILDKMREYGEATVIDVNKTSKKSN